MTARASIAAAVLCAAVSGCGGREHPGPPATAGDDGALSAFCRENPGACPNVDGSPADVPRDGPASGFSAFCRENPGACPNVDGLPADVPPDGPAATTTIPPRRTTTAPTRPRRSVRRHPPRRDRTAVDSASLDARSDLVVTENGGRTAWRQSVPGPGVVAVAVPARGVVLALSTHGDLRRQVRGGRWRLVRLHGVVTGLAAQRGHAWAVVARCPACAVRVWRSADAGRRWRSARLGAAQMRLPHQLAMRGVEVPGSVTFYGVRHGAVALGRRLAVTDDGGRRWRVRRSPCGRYDITGPYAATGPRRNVWVACAGPAAAGSQLKLLLRSDDDGRSFRRVPADGRDERRGLPGGGYLGTLTVVGARDAYVALDRLNPAVTHDGGERWSEASFPLDAEPFVGPVVVSATVAWQVVGDKIWRTTDGGRRWRRGRLRG